MSDYEGDWDNGEWEQIKSQVNSFVSAAPPSVPPDPLHNYTYPRGTNLREAKQVIQQKPRREQKSLTSVLPQNYRPTLQNLRPSTTSGFKASHDSITEQAPKHVQRRVLELEAFDRYQKNRDQPDAQYEMMQPFNKVSQRLPKDRNISPRQALTDELAKICTSTGAFIEVPDDDSYVLKIWGSPEEIQRAKDTARSFEMYVAGPGTSTSRGSNKPWIKQRALDAREEDRNIRESLRINEQNAFQYADESLLPYEAHLIWPEGYDLQDFVADYDQGVLERLRDTFTCHITHTREGTRATRIACETQQSLFQVYNRLLGLMKEMVAKKKQGLRATQCRLPGANDFCKRTSLEKVAITSYPFTAHIPKPVGVEHELPPGEEHWPQLSKASNKRYRNATKKALRSCINGLYLSEKHVRMRVSFGTIALTKLKRPANGQDTYEVEEFINMVQQPNVEARMLPLSSGASFDLIDYMDTLSEFGEPDISWALECCFTGAQGSLRLEKEFTASHIDPDKPNVAAIRWLDDSSNQLGSVGELLKIHHMVLGKVGYTFEMVAAGIYQNQKTKQELRGFSDKVDLKPSLKGLRFAPAKHALFPPSNRDLKAMREITIARYSYKDTKGTFEIRRTDTFPQNAGEASAVPASIEWTAVYYYEEWDRLMAQFANIRPGEDVEWKRDLTTFFPKVVDEDHPTMLPAGYKKFMDEVEEIQALLTRATEALSAAEPVHTDSRKGVNGSTEY
ncbi:hypothetical protein LTR05_005198 [Lithohypha guttulata]|uniref:DUF7905 domain-containing protein n=1 Tax=Lithohypha guttulata TaxID=1690604 RepID=A0AAN7T0H0_9EURO|nr:hypothetical protein LTR05_005198 [Lithohypha guttulata]